jgi:hypothetical protein
VDERTPTLRFGPNRWLATGFGVVALAFLALALSVDDRNGRLLYSLAALVLVAVCALDLIWNPRLVLDAQGLHLHTPTSSGLVAWSDVERVHVDDRSRLGLSSRTLEIDAGAQLVILSRRALGGTEPRDVAAMIETYRPGLVG